MCTLTLVPYLLNNKTALRIAFNRDEKRTRPVALSPILVEHSTLMSCHPVDLPSSGTWIAASAAGLIFTLLNVNPSCFSQNCALKNRSRGEIILKLLAAKTIDHAVQIMSTINLHQYLSFRLLVTNVNQWHEFFFNGEDIKHNEDFHTVGKAILRTSSSFAEGDICVQRPRLDLWNEMNSDNPDILEMQEMYHRHRWPQNGALSVHMSRPDARTVSHTVVDLNAYFLLMRYFNDADVFSKQGFSAPNHLTTLPVDFCDSCRGVNFEIDQKWS